MPPHQLQFIIDALDPHKSPGSVRKFARHQYGCRILQRLLEHCTEDQVHTLLNDLLLDDVVALSMHAYGKFVVPHIFEYGGAEQKLRFANILLQKPDELVGKEGDKSATMVSSRNGWVIIKHALETLGDEDKPSMKIALDALLDKSTILA